MLHPLTLVWHLPLDVPPTLLTRADEMIGIRAACCNCSQPVMALNGRLDTHQICPLSKVNRSCHRAAAKSHVDPIRTFDALMTVRPSITANTLPLGFGPLAGSSHLD
jgi:hypothetical protein